MYVYYVYVCVYAHTRMYIFQKKNIYIYLSGVKISALTQTIIFFSLTLYWGN